VRRGVSPSNSAWRLTPSLSGMSATR
jgi:hypothetical protein